MKLLQKSVTLFLCSFIGWISSEVVFELGSNKTSLENALLIHAIGVPIIFVFISIFYFKTYNYTKPIFTAFLFLLIVMFLDVFVLAIYIQKSYDMFRNFLRTWIPFILLFEATYITGTFVNKKKP